MHRVRVRKLAQLFSPRVRVCRYALCTDLCYMSSFTCMCHCQHNKKERAIMFTVSFHPPPPRPPPRTGYICDVLARIVQVCRRNKELIMFVSTNEPACVFELLRDCLSSNITARTLLNSSMRERPNHRCISTHRSIIIINSH